MRPLVVDASAAVAYVLAEPGAKEVEDAISGRDTILAPWLFWSEVVNTLARRHRWPGDRVLASIYDLEQLGVRTEQGSRPYLLAVVDAVEAHGLSAYDAEYLVLAEASDADLLTADRQLAAAAGDRAVLVGPQHRLRERAVPYGHQRPVHWPSWPGAVRYLEALRREIA